MSPSVAYEQYIRSGEWERKARVVKEHFRWRCGVCRKDWQKRGGRLDAHHLRYYDERGQSILGREVMSDFRPLCDLHHKQGYYPLPEIKHDRRVYLTKKFLWWVVTIPWRLACLLVAMARGKA